jgi:hypothetical protein
VGARRANAPRRQALQPQHLNVEVVINLAERIHIKVAEIDLREVQRRRRVAVDGEDHSPSVVVLDEERKKVQLERVVLQLATEACIGGA